MKYQQVDRNHYCCGCSEIISGSLPMLHGRSISDELTDKWGKMNTVCDECRLEYCEELFQACKNDDEALRELIGLIHRVDMPKGVTI